MSSRRLLFILALERKTRILKGHQESFESHLIILVLSFKEETIDDLTSSYNNYRKIHII